MRNYTKSTMSHCLLALIRRFFETSRTHLLGGGWARNPPPPFVSVCSFTRYHWCSFWPKCSADSTSFRETFVLLVCVVTPTEGPGSRVVTPVLHEANARAISALKLRKLESVGRIIRRGRAALCQG